MPPGFDGDLELGADAVVGGDQDRVLEAGRLQIEQPAETAEVGIGAGPARRSRQRLDRFDQRVAGIDIDAGLAIGQRSIGAPAGTGHTFSRAFLGKRL